MNLARYTDGFFQVGPTHGFLPCKDPLAILPPRYNHLQTILHELARIKDDGEEGILGKEGEIEKRIAQLPNYGKEVEKESEETVSNFKIFTDEEKEFPSKEEMDKNLDNFRLERDKNLNFFQKLFKKDRLKEAAKALEKKKNQQQSDEEKNKIDVARRTRLLFYLLILLFIVFSVLIVPLREEVGMAFPFMEKYLEFLIPMYDYIKGPLGFE